MTDIKDIFLFSYRELKKVRTITTVAMFVALSIILGAFTVPIGNFLKIGFSSLTTVSVGYLFGPIVGSVFGALTDVVKYAIKPTGPFFPGFTLNAIIAGFIYGSILYKKQVDIKRIFIAEFFVSLFCNILLGTLWLNILYGKAFLAILPMRALKNIILLPINSFMAYAILKFLEQYKQKIK